MDDSKRESLQPAGIAALTFRESEEAPPCETPRRLATLIRAAILVSAMYRGRRGREKHGVVDYDPYDGFSTSKMRPPPRFSRRTSSTEDAAEAPLVQVAGHGMLERERPGVVRKLAVARELAAYRTAPPDLADHLPSFHGADEVGDASDGGGGGRCGGGGLGSASKSGLGMASIFIEDLTAGLRRPCVMDVKMGTRTFQEKVVDDPSRRTDMTKKIQDAHKSDPDLASEVAESNLTEDEAENGVTKVRYMQWREMATTTHKHGWRIEGIVLAPSGSDAPAAKVDVPKSLRKEKAMRDMLRKYLQKSPRHARDLGEKLSRLRVALEASDWFATHEVVSSSLLCIYDAADPPRAPPGVWMIDFANCLPTKEKLNHRTPWSKGNHEEGYLLGLDDIIETFAYMEKHAEAD